MSNLPDSFKVRSGIWVSAIKNYLVLGICYFWFIRVRKKEGAGAVLFTAEN